MSMINNVTQPSFGARYIHSGTAKRLLHDNYQVAKTSFAQIEPESKEDMSALYNLVKYWPDSYTSNIYLTANQLKRGLGLFANNKIYVSTSQKNNFEELNDEKVLGLVEVIQKEPRKAHVSYLQVNPEYVYRVVPTWKGIGTGILDSLKKLNDVITLKPNSESSRVFYANNGFVQDELNPNQMIWCKNKFL